MGSARSPLLIEFPFRARTNSGLLLCQPTKFLKHINRNSYLTCPEQTRLGSRPPRQEDKLPAPWYEDKLPLLDMRLNCRSRRHEDKLPCTRGDQGPTQLLKRENQWVQGQSWDLIKVGFGSYGLWYLLSVQGNSMLARSWRRPTVRTRRQQRGEQGNSLTRHKLEKGRKPWEMVR